MNMIVTSSRRTLAVLGLALAGWLGAGAAQAAGLELKTEAFHEVEVQEASGKKSKKLEALTRALPGQEVIYVISYRNTGPKAADAVILKNPVPKGLVFQPGSAQGASSKPEVSVDGARQYGALEKLTVPGPDGKPRAATAEDVTDVRWTLLSPVKPAGQGQVSYRARLK